ncbi:hypothetical protein [Dactylosporangium sp. NPDC049140]|uniref:hypothetical protein n=1 Tax=Dactylosporangium sp. NPDC049140 TaxID=3155647 RepID=UPI0033CEC0D7
MVRRLRPDLGEQYLGDLALLFAGPCTCAAVRWALHLRGDQVLVAVPRPLHQQVRRAGLTAAVVGGDASFFELWPSGRDLVGNNQVLPGCALFVHHGGSGSSMAASMRAAGAARVVPFPERCAQAVRVEAAKLLSDDGYHVRAAELVAEIAAMPSPSAVAETIARTA